MTVTDQRNSFYLSHSFPLTPFSALRQEYYCFCVPEMGVLGIDISASGRARNGFPISSKSAKVKAQKETGRLAKLPGTEEFSYIRKYRRCS